MATNGQTFEDQIRKGIFDPFAVLGLHAEDANMSARLVRLHAKKVVMPHVFERGLAGALTVASNVPTWAQVNKAREMLDTEEKVTACKRMWAHQTVQTWNPYAAPASPEAYIPLNTTALPQQYTSLPNNTRRKARTNTASSAPTTPNRAGPSTASNPPVTPTRPAPATASSGVSGQGTYRAPYVLDEDDEVAAFTACSRPSTPPNTGTASNLVSPARRRYPPAGVYVGQWLHSGLPLNACNAVYASRDSIDRVHRRISKEDNFGHVVTAGSYDPKRTACKHEDIAYIAKYANKTKEQVDAMIGTTLQQLASNDVAPAAGPLMLTWVNLDEDDEEEE